MNSHTKESGQRIKSDRNDESVNDVPETVFGKMGCGWLESALAEVQSVPPDVELVDLH